MIVREVMTTRVHTIREDASFEEIVNLLIHYNINGAPVVNYERNLIGILSEKDLISHLFPTQKKFYQNLGYYLDHNRIEKEAAKIKKLKAKDLMTKEVITIGPDDHILKACALLLLHNIRRLPVVNNGELVGIVSTSDIFKNFLRKIH